MSSAASTRPRRVVKSAINTPITSHILKSKNLSKEEGQKILDAFIEDCEHVANKTLTSSALESGTSISKYEGPNPTTRSQLKRLQRELRGLPPLLLDGQSERQSTQYSESKGSKPNKKIVFEDGAPKVNKKIVFEDESTAPVAITTQDDSETEKEIVKDEGKKSKKRNLEEAEEEKARLAKEEKKRLKKERRALEMKKKHEGVEA